MRARELSGLERHNDKNLILIRDACCRQGGNLDLLRQVEKIIEERKLEKERSRE